MECIDPKELCNARKCSALARQGFLFHKAGAISRVVTFHFKGNANTDVTSGELESNRCLQNTL